MGGLCGATDMLGDIILLSSCADGRTIADYSEEELPKNFQVIDRLERKRHQTAKHGLFSCMTTCSQAIVNKLKPTQESNLKHNCSVTLIR